jgi:hypothetical protein
MASKSCSIITIYISSSFLASKSLLPSEHLAEFASMNADNKALSTPTVHMQNNPWVLACSLIVK